MDQVRRPAIDLSPAAEAEKLVHKQSLVQLAPGVAMILGSGELFRHVDPNEYMWNGEGHRSFSAFVSFEKPVERTPAVFVGLSSIDASHAQNLRINLDVGRVFTNGFEAIATTWSNTKLASVSINWFAVVQSPERRLAQIMGGRGDSTQSI